MVFNHTSVAAVAAFDTERDMKRILRLREVLAARGKSRSGHYRDIRLGLFTPPIALGVRARGWPDDEVSVLNEAKIAGLTDEEIRRIVKKLKAARGFKFKPSAAQPVGVFLSVE